MADSGDGESALLLGGISSQTTYDKTLWNLATSKYSWERYQTKTNIVEPKARWKGTLCRVDANSVLLFGGSDEVEYFDDVWLLKVSTKERLLLFNVERG